MALNDKFRARFKKRIEKTKTKTELFFTKLILETDARLVSKSPVDTGRFKANWVIGNSFINTGISERVSALPLGASDNYNANLIDRIDIKGQTIYLTNSLPYAQRLEYGWSKQAPGGMVRITLAEMQGIARQIGAELRLA